MNNNDLTQLILDALIESWETDETKTPAESLEQSLAVIKGAVEPAIADLERRLEMARVALISVKIRICFINHPREAMHNGQPDWSKQIELIEQALAQLAAPLGPVEGTPPEVKLTAAEQRWIDDHETAEF
jgi:hypothetical protein